MLYKAVSVCLECLSNRGFDDLSRITCQKFGPGPQTSTTTPDPQLDNDTQMPSSNGTEEDNDNVVATVLTIDDADEIDNAVKEMLEAKVANEEKEDDGVKNENEEEPDSIQ